MSKHTWVFRFVKRSASLFFFFFLLINLLFPANINPAKAEGSKELVAFGGKRALTEWRVDTTAGLYRRTFFRVYAQAGENILMGSSAMGLGLGDIVLYQEGQIANSQITPAALTAITPTFVCSVGGGGQGVLRGATAAATRSMEVVGATTNGGVDGGYIPCAYTVPVGGTGTYWVAMYGPLGVSPAVNVNGASGTVALPNITASQASGVSVWDITVRAGNPLTGTNKPSRVFVDYLAQITGGNGVSNQVFSSLYAATADGYVYQVDLNGLDPFGYILYGNRVGFLDPDGTTPLYHDVVYPDNQLSNPAGGVTLPPASARIFFSNPLLSDLPASILPTPIAPTITNISYLGSAGGVDGYRSIGGQFTFTGNVVGIGEIVISRDGIDFQPDNALNRVIRTQAAVGTNIVNWDGRDNAGAFFPVGTGYKYHVTFHAGEYHFPLLDAENSPNGGPSLTLLNPVGGVCPFSPSFNCHTGFYDDRGYRVSTGTIVGTVGVTLPGDANSLVPPVIDHSDNINGFDTSTNQRAWGNGTGSGFGNRKALDLWTYIPVGPIVNQLNVVDLNPLMTVSKSSTTTSLSAPGTVTYSYLVTNTGNVTLTGIALSDDNDNNDISCPATSLAPTATMTCTATHTFTQAELDANGSPTVASSNLTNIVTASSNEAPDATDTLNIPIVQNPSMTVSKSSTTTSLSAPGTVTYSYLVTNTGNVTLTGIVLSDDNDNNDMSCPAASLAPTATMTCSATHTFTQTELNANGSPIAASGTLTNIVTASSNEAPDTTDTLVIPITQTPSMTVAKSSTTTILSAPGTVTYSYLVTNTGNVTLTGIVLSDDNDNNDMSCPATTLAPTATMICTATHTFTQSELNANGSPTAASGTLTNIVTASSNEAPDTIDTLDIPITQTPSMTVVKSSTTTSLIAPGTVTYSYLVTNTGNVILTGIVLSDDNDNNDMSCPVTSLAPTATMTCTATHTFTQAELSANGSPTAASGTLTNIVTASSNEAPDARDTLDIPIAQTPSMTVAKSSTTTSLGAPGTVTYSYLVTNTGNTILTGIALSDDNDNNDISCPSTTLALSATMTCTATHTFTQAELNANGSPTASSGTLTNIVTASSNEAPVATDTLNIPIVQTPSMTVAKSSTTTSLSAPGTVTYSYLVTNTGNVILTGIVLSDDNDNNDMSCPATTLVPSATMTCTATHTFTQAELSANGSPTAASGTLTNIVTASSNEAPDTTDTLDIPIENVDLALTKTVNNTSPKVGDAIIFTITITNQSLTTAATNVVVDDVLPTGLSFNSATPTIGSFNNTTGDWTIAALAANASATLIINATVTQVGVITNTAEVVAVDQFDTDSTPNNRNPNEDDQASVSIGGLFDPPSGIKSFSEAGLPQLEFRMVWINSGNTTTINTQVVDNIPAGTTYVSGSIVCTPMGSSANAIAATVPLNTTVTNSFCAFDPINNRIQWQGFIGPDNGNLTEAAAANEVVITFRVTVNDGVNQVVNFGSSRTDTDGDTDFTDETVLGTSLIITNQVVWNRSAVVDVDNGPVNTPAPAASGGFLIPVTGFEPDVVTKLNPPSGPAYESTNLTIKIPSIKVNTSIVGVEQKDEDWDVSWLQNQAGWLSGTAYPTWKGNSVVTAHVVNADGKPGVFFKLKHLKSGEYIFVYNRGYRYTYKVESNEFVQPDDISVLKHESKSYLTLITCDTYDEETGTYLRRVAVRALLVDVREIK